MLAQKHNLPVIIHGRNSKDGTKLAYQEILQIVKKYNLTRGVMTALGAQ